MNPYFPRILRAAALAGLLSSAAIAGAATTVTVTEGADTQTFKDSTTPITVTGNRKRIDVLVDGEPLDVAVSFASAHGRRLIRGTVSEAEKTDDRTGLAAGVDGTWKTSCPEVWGSYTIRQLGFDKAGKLLTLDATVRRACSADGVPTVFVIKHNVQPLSYGYVSSSLYDWLGAGRTRNYLPDASVMTLDEGVTYHQTQSLRYRITGNGESWDVLFWAPISKPKFTAGTTYTVTEDGGVGVGGIRVGGTRYDSGSGSYGRNGVGCSRHYGYLTIHAIRTDADGRVTGLNATFEVNCDGSTHTYKGTIRHYL